MHDPSFARFTGIALLLVVAQAAAAGPPIYSVTDLGTLNNTTFSLAQGLSQTGKVTGFCGGGMVQGIPFLYDGTLHVLPSLPSSAYTEGNDVNDLGVVTGTGYGSSGVPTQAFVYDGMIHPLGTFGGANSAAIRINNHGTVVGYADTPTASHAFVYDGTMHDIGTLPDASYSSASGINDSGLVCGYSGPTPNMVHAFLYDGVMKDLGTVPGFDISIATSISSTGLVAGFFRRSATDLSTTHAFLYDGQMHDIGAASFLARSTVNFANGVNSMGQVVGDAAVTSGNADVPFLYQNGLSYNLNDLIDPNSGWVLKDVDGINDAGQIAGFGNIGNTLHACLLTPVPEPSGALVMADIVGLVAGSRGFRRLGRSTRPH